MYQYLLVVKFCAGSDEPEDVDTGLFLMTIDREIKEQEMKNIFSETNKALDYFNDEDNDFPISYEQGLNIGTLMKGVAIYTKGTVSELQSNCGDLAINNYFFIEQWQ